MTLGAPNDAWNALRELTGMNVMAADPNGTRERTSIRASKWEQLRKSRGTDPSETPEYQMVRAPDPHTDEPAGVILLVQDSTIFRDDSCLGILHDPALDAIVVQIEARLHDQKRCVLGIDSGRIADGQAILDKLLGEGQGKLIIRGEHSQPGENPLTMARETQAEGCGPIHGTSLIFVDACELGETTNWRRSCLAWAACEPDAVLAASYQIGEGELVIIGSASSSAQHLLGSDNAAMWYWAACGHDGSSAQELISNWRPQHRGVHPQVPHVDMSAGRDHATLCHLMFDTVEQYGERKLLGGAQAWSAVQALSTRLPDALTLALMTFADDSTPAGALLVRGLPIGDLPATPATPGETTIKSNWTELLLLSIARTLGQPVGYSAEHGGHIVQNIVAVKETRDRQVSTSSGVTLMFHTEAAFHPHKPRYLLLLCLRGDPSKQAATLLSSIQAVSGQLSLRAQQALRQPRFVTQADESYLGARPTTESAPRAVIGGRPGNETLVFDVDLMRGIDNDAQRALVELSELVEACHVSVTLEAGDLLIVDNSVAVHGRTPFTPNFDGRDRWLQRSFVIPDLSEANTDRDGRVITTRFLP